MKAIFKKYSLVILFFFGIQFFAISQVDKNKVDSMKRVIENAKIDTSKINAYIELSDLIFATDPEEAMKIAEKIISIAKKSIKQGNKDKKHLKILHGKLSYGYNNLGLIYMNQSDYPNALKNFYSALKIAEKENDKRRLFTYLDNVGIIYNFQENYQEALKYHQKSMDILLELKWREKMPATLTNMAIVQYNIGNNQKAIDNFLLAIDILEELGDDSGLATVYSNIANLYSLTGELDKALTYQEKSVGIRKKLNDPLGMAYSYSGMGILNYQLGKYRLSDEYSYKAIELAKSMKNLELLKENYWLLYLNDSATNDFKSAFENHKIYIAYRDSILNDENNKKITEQKIQYSYDKKTLEDSLVNAKHKEIQEAEIAKQEAELETKKFQQFILFGGLIIVFVFAGVMYSRFKITRKQKSIIELQKKEVEVQKELVEEKQKEIVDSINYAKRIQYALLAHEEIMQKYLPEHFVLFKPKDIVSGDFYWFTHVKDVKNEFSYLAVCDSTGHGVPGAFMSLLNISFINEAIIEKGILSPDKVFDHARIRLIQNLGAEGQQDGFDGILIRFDQQTEKMVYAAANNSPILVSDDETIVLPCDKMPVGKGELSSDFELFEIPQGKKGILYLPTDGYSDQFGGEKGKKLKFSNMLKYLNELKSENIVSQKSILDSRFEKWRGELEQVDDVCIIGVKI